MCLMSVNQGIFHPIYITTDVMGGVSGIREEVAGGTISTGKAIRESIAELREQGLNEREALALVRQSQEPQARTSLFVR